MLQRQQRQEGGTWCRLMSMRVKPEHSDERKQSKSIVMGSQLVRLDPGHATPYTDGSAMQANCNGEPNSRLPGLASHCQLSGPSVLCLTRSSSLWSNSKLL